MLLVYNYVEMLVFLVTNESVVMVSIYNIHVGCRRCMLRQCDVLQGRFCWDAQRYGLREPPLCFIKVCTLKSRVRSLYSPFARCCL